MTPTSTQLKEIEKEAMEAYPECGPYKKEIDIAKRIGFIKGYLSALSSYPMSAEDAKEAIEQIKLLKARDYLWANGENPNKVAKKGVHFVHGLIAKTRKEGTQKTHEEYCDLCDGVGWYEGGGPTLQTFCTRCNGTGILTKINKP